MTKRKSDYAIVLSCNPGYGFGMMSSMNAQNYFGTDADWEIAYENFTPEQREKISNAFPFNVNWTLIGDLMKDVVDKRTGTHGALNRYWLAYWLLAHKLLREKKYKAVCVIQADTFIFVNLDNYFKIAESGTLVCSEHPNTTIKVNDFKFGDDKSIWDRAMCGIFDSVNFIGQQYTEVPKDIVLFQCEDAFNRESNHSVICLNRSVCKHGQKDRVLGLDRRLWACDSIWSTTKLYIHDDRVYNDRKIQLKAWHCRWWQEGRVKAEWNNTKEIVINNKDNPAIMQLYANKEHNYRLVKSFMEKFNNMTPEVKSEIYLKGVIKRPRYELGEK